MSNSYFEFNHKLFRSKHYQDDYAVLFLSVHQNAIDFELTRHNSLKVSRQGLDGEIKLSKTSIKLLSTPYMEKCKNYGKYIFSQF